MFIKRNIVVVLFALMVVGFVSACGSALKESGGDQTGAGGGLAQTATYVGLQNCYTCHNQTKFNQWAKSRHANFDLGDGTRIDYSSMEAVGSTSGTTYGYDEITGDPGPHLAADGTDRCAPCHTGPDYGGDILDINAGGDVFTNPNIGEVNRSIIDCEACHGGGSFHYGVGALPYPQPAFDQCTLCHADAATEHHSLDSKYSWANSVGANVGSDSNIAPASTATGLEVWQLVAHSGTAWTGTYAGPYYYSGDHTINDTHFNEFWIKNEDNKLTRYISANAKLGYVDTSNISPNSGMARKDSLKSCTASCHKPHEFDLTINLEWAKSGHHPTPEGPLTAGAPSGPDNWGAIEHNFSSACVRCHTAYGFAAVAPNSAGNAPTSVPTGKGAYITCNACHNGVDYPSSSNLRLRFTGVVNLYDHDGAVADSVNANNSAVCSYCHQGRSTGQYIKNNYATALSTSNFGGANSHYLAAAGILFRSDARPMGYEYMPAIDYSNEPDFEHNTIGIVQDGIGLNGPCVTCHMHDTTSGSGEHANHLYTPFKIDANGDPIDDTPADVCLNCHDGSEAAPDWTIPGAFAAKADGFADALGILEDELGAQTPAIYYNPLAYPYFYPSSDPVQQTYGNAFKAWPDEQTLGAAFNLNLLTKEPGAFAHNSLYTERLIFDSIDFLEDGTLDGTIADYSSLGHPAGAAWLGTTRP